MMAKAATLPDYDAALRAALDIVTPVDDQDVVALHEAINRTLAGPVTADRDLPAFNRAQMDGYAVRTADVKADGVLPVSATVSAGASPQVRVPPGACVKIATGAAVPDGLDAVIQHELSDRNDPVRFTVESIAPGHAIHRRGADAKAGDVLIESGTQLAAHHLGIAAAVGCAELKCIRRPTAAVLSSGDEVRDIEDDLQPHQIRNSNGPMVSELLRAMGAEPAAAHLLPDDRQQTIDTVARVIEDHDLLITIGGISAGERDHFPEAFDAAGVERAVAGASIQPGKPVIVGRAPNGTIIVGLPGNPVSSLACACLFIWPIVYRMLGNIDPLPWRTITLSQPVRPNPKRRAFRPARLNEDHSTGYVPPWAGSGDLAHTARTHGLAQLPVQGDELSAGAGVSFLPWPQ